MKFIVPVKKEGQFAMAFFRCISDNLDELRMETNKWPDQIIFSGPLGKELFEFLEKSGWDFKQFNPQFEGIANKITFKNSKVLTIIEDNNAPILDSSLGNNMMNGIIGKETMSKITAAYSGSTNSFRKEKTVRPQISIQLVRA